jgi:DNA-binding transcriptional LysR family regulator
VGRARCAALAGAGRGGPCRVHRVGRAAPGFYPVGPHIAYETRDYQVTLALIEAGLGISLVPASVLGHTSRPGIAFRPVEGMSLARAIYLVHRKRTTALVTDIKTMITDLNHD